MFLSKPLIMPFPSTSELQSHSNSFPPLKESAIEANGASLSGPVTLKNVAAYAQANLGSVSSVLNGSQSTSRVSSATRERILKAATELGYVANPHAQRLKGRRNQKLVQIFSLYPLLPAIGGIIGKMQGELRLEGFDAPFHGYADFSTWGPTMAVNQAALLSELRRSKPRAIICHMSGLQEESLAELQGYQAEGGVLVTFDQASTLPCDQIVFNAQENNYCAARHLLEQGHRRLGLYQSEPKPLSLEQYQGFERALQEFGLELRKEWLFWATDSAGQGGIGLAEKFLALPHQQRPTGMCVMNDVAASAFTSTLAQAGVRVPEEVSVVGHDDAEFSAYLTPPLTTVAYSQQQIVLETLKMLRDRLENGFDRPPCQVTVQGELVRRHSTRPPAAIHVPDPIDH